jgi:hypothetical protein
MARVADVPVRLAAAIGGATYLVTLLAVALIDRETDLLRTHPEDYATGVAGALVNVGYVAVALMALAIAASLVREGRWLSVIAAALLAGGGVTSLVLATAPQEVTGGPLLVGVLALALSPLLVSIGADGRLSPVAVALGVIVTLGFVAYILLSPRELAGIANRSWDALLAVWGVSFGLRSRPAMHPMFTSGAS